MEPKVFIPSNLKIKNSNGKMVGVARTIMSAGIGMDSVKVKARQNGVLVDKAVWVAIRQYDEMGGFGGMPLKAYLIKLFKNPQPIVP